MLKNKAEITDAMRMEFNPFDGDRDVDIRRHIVKIVKTRKLHRCAGADLLANSHEIAIGERAWCESAIVDGQPGSCYVCLPCFDKLLFQTWGETKDVA